MISSDPGMQPPTSKGRLGTAPNMFLMLGFLYVK